MSTTGRECAVTLSANASFNDSSHNNSFMVHNTDTGHSYKRVCKKKKL